MSAVIDNVLDFPETLEDIVHQYINAKAAEEGARRIRVALEERILDMHPAPDEGSTTTALGNGFKLSVVAKLSYKCDDPREVAEACVGWGWEPSMVPVKTRLELDETGCKWLRHNEPQAWAQLSRLVTVKPMKTTVSVRV